MGQGLPPIGQRERGVGVLGLAERVGRIRIFEAVKEGDPAQEGLLGSGRAGVREDDSAELARVLVVRVRLLLGLERSGPVDTERP